MSRARSRPLRRFCFIARERAFEPDAEHARRSCCSTTSRSLEVAQEEHDAFAGALRDDGVEVVYLEDLMAEVLDDRSRRCASKFLDAVDRRGWHPDRPATHSIIIDYIDSENYPDTKDHGPEDHGGHQPAPSCTPTSTQLCSSTWCARPHEDGRRAPMPNLYFTRDPLRHDRQRRGHQPHVFGQTRNRETIYGEYIFNYHPDFKDVPQYYSRYNTFHIEGGDILNINEHVLAIGISQRTEPDAIDQLAHNIFDDATSHHRHHPGVQHPELPRLHAPGHRVHPDRLSTSSPSIPASWAR